MHTDFVDLGIQGRKLPSQLNLNPTPVIGLSLVKSKLCTNVEYMFESFLFCLARSESGFKNISLDV